MLIASEAGNDYYGQLHRIIVVLDQAKMVLCASCFRLQWISLYVFCHILKGKQHNRPFLRFFGRRLPSETDTVKRTELATLGVNSSLEDVTPIEMEGSFEHNRVTTECITHLEQPL